MRQVACALSLLLLVAAGCGPSYSEAVQLYEAERSELERLMDGQREYDEATQEDLSHLEGLIFKSVQLGADSESLKEDRASLAKYRKEYKEIMAKYDAAIERQQKRVDAANEVRLELSP